MNVVHQDVYEEWVICVKGDKTNRWCDYSRKHQEGTVVGVVSPGEIRSSEEAILYRLCKIIWDRWDIPTRGSSNSGTARKMNELDIGLESVGVAE